MSIEPGVRLGRYEIRSKIGEGGMGEVYLAEDTQLHRKVALKILPAELAANKDRMRRFNQEATAAAALNHPNIAHIYEIGESEGIHFIAMEFIDGETLREKIREPHDLRKLLRFLQHCAEGLARAHAAGIVHRDLKPDNIMITRDGHAKILDFGLAKLIEPQPLTGSGSSEVATAVMPQHSTPGAVMGTVGYMSPEQAQGKTKEIDQRSDVFSFGCILFEAATGQKPFEGDSVIKSLHKVVYEPAPSITDLNPAAPAELQRIVRRCLAKDPDERYQSIKEIAIELKELRRGEFPAGPAVGSSTTQTGASNIVSDSGTSTRKSASVTEQVGAGISRNKVAAILAVILLLAGAVSLWLYPRARNSEAPIESIAVLPFQNQSKEAETDYLSDGVTESIINSLSQLPHLKVMARTTVFQYRGRDHDAQKVGKELGVEAVLTGTFLKQGDTLAIQVDLVRVADGSEIWGEKYTRKLADIFAVQSELANEISDKLQLHLSGAEQQLLKKQPTGNAEAYELYLKAYLDSTATMDSAEASSA